MCSTDGNIKMAELKRFELLDGFHHHTHSKRAPFLKSTFQSEMFFFNPLGLIVYFKVRTTFQVIYEDNQTFLSRIFCRLIDEPFIAKFSNDR
jgi:hypothetical protein